MAKQPIYLDQALTNVANAWENTQEDFIADKLFPVVTVKKPTFKIPEYGKENLNLPASTVRTGLSKALSVSQTRSYKQAQPLVEHALSGVVTEDDYELTDDPFEPESDETENILSVMALVDEKALADKLTDPLVVTNNRTLLGTDRWSDYANSDPFNDIKTAVTSSKFIKYNTMALSRDGYLSLISHPDILDRLKWAQGGAVSLEQLKQLFGPFGITNIYIGQARANLAPEGLDEDIQNIWGNDVLFGFVTPKPGRKQLNGGYKFVLTDGRKATKEQLSDPDHTKIVVKDRYNYEMLMNDAWYLLKDAFATGA
ncbi:hypothetical protein KRR55_06110 [Paeniglutamicibacter sp. ABSL32-1]|uniref:hypothetical protein n=1 Tax=Paeniglutamicibacter quisquiliarum TaxID=2849498 RepID=UPI001C2DAEE6|nr:hypothetical protein [Paeniglutamicibacter quisquiliarum]MBV1778686.1 hypothetical protein [Paeniglutamicibacter quisquiliarum]